jgi:hypothetical protein
MVKVKVILMLLGLILSTLLLGCTEPTPIISPGQNGNGGQFTVIGTLHTNNWGSEIFSKCADDSNVLVLVKNYESPAIYVLQNFVGLEKYLNKAVEVKGILTQKVVECSERKECPVGAFNNEFVCGKLDVNKITLHKIDDLKNPLPDSNLCSYYIHGWSCSLTNDINFGLRGDEFKSVEEKFVNECHKQNGQWDCDGYCMPSYDHRCRLPLKDVNKECTNSLECQGLCLINEKYLVDKYPGINFWNRRDMNLTVIGLKGSCAAYEVDICDGYVEYFNGKLIPKYALCD